MLRKLVTLGLVGLFLVISIVVAKDRTSLSNFGAGVAASGCVVIRVEYRDGYPRQGAHVFKVDPLPELYLGTTNESGLVTSCGVLNPGSYIIRAFYPAGTQFGPDAYLGVYPDGSGSATIRWSDYEITPPAIQVLSPQNQTYTNKSIPLTYTIYDYSPISWIGYSLDGQASTTITGNTTLTDLSLGSHHIVVYSNDTFGNMGSSETVHFTRELGCVVIRVQYLDGYPRSGADVFTVPPPEPAHSLGTTNESGLTVRCGVLSPGDYEIRAYYPIGIQFGPSVLLTVDENGNGMQTITASYEITHPSIEILSPQNLTYTNGSVPLTFTVYDYSLISWIGYSLDSQPNTTITGNTIINVEEGSHYLAVYANDTFGNMGSSQIVYFTVRTGISDIAVTHIVGSKAVVGQNYSMFINFTVDNQGDYIETFNVTVYANTTSIATQTITLSSGNSTTITFTWDTAGFAKGNYTIKAYAWPVPGETDVADNNRTAVNSIFVGIPGDINGDRKVDLKDVYAVAKAYGSYTGQPKYKPNLDINDDGKIDLKDYYITTKNYGKVDP